MCFMFMSEFGEQMYFKNAILTSLGPTGLTSVDGVAFPGNGGRETVRGRGLSVDVHLVDEEEGEAAVTADPLAEQLVNPLQN